MYVERLAIARSLAVLLALTLALVAPASAAAQPAMGACTPIFAAGEKRIAVPHHIYTEQTQAGTTRAGEIISVPEGQYLFVQGQWLRSPLSPTLDEALEEHRTSFREARSYTCRKLRNESVNGVPAEVYQMHSVTDEGISDGQMWVAMKTGLPIKQEVDLEVRIGIPGKRHTSARYEYTNVQKPANAIDP